MVFEVDPVEKGRVLGERSGQLEPWPKGCTYYCVGKIRSCKDNDVISVLQLIEACKKCIHSLTSH